MALGLGLFPLVLLEFYRFSRVFHCPFHPINFKFFIPARYFFPYFWPCKENTFCIFAWEFYGYFTRLLAFWKNFLAYPFRREGELRLFCFGEFRAPWRLILWLPTPPLDAAACSDSRFGRLAASATLAVFFLYSMFSFVFPFIYFFCKYKMILWYFQILFIFFYGLFLWLWG